MASSKDSNPKATDASEKKADATPAENTQQQKKVLEEDDEFEDFPVDGTSEGLLQGAGCGGRA